MAVTEQDTTKIHATATALERYEFDLYNYQRAAAKATDWARIRDEHAKALRASRAVLMASPVGTLDG